MSVNLIRTALINQWNTIPGIIPTVALSLITIGTPGIFTTATPHGLISGIYVVMSGITGGTPAIADNYIVQVIDANNFSLLDAATQQGISVTIAGSGGSVSANLTSWPNAMFQAVVGVPYAKIDWVDAVPSEPTQGGGFRIEQGYMQVTFVYPPGIGTGALLARIELIRSYFKKAMAFSYGGITVQIMQSPQLGSFNQSQDQITQVLRIYHSTQIFS
jgi:hypothetical protein